MSKEEIIKFLSDKYKIPRYSIKQIIDSPIKVICESLYKREMKGFIIPYLGKFIINPRKIIWLEDNLMDKLKEKDKLKEQKKLDKKNEVK